MGGLTAWFPGPLIITRFIAAPVSLHIQSSILQGMGRCHQGRGLGAFQAWKCAAYSRDISSSLNCRQILLGLAGQAIFILLFQIVNSPLRNLLFLSPFCISTLSHPSRCMRTHPPWTISFRQQLTPVLISCCKLIWGVGWGQKRMGWYPTHPTIKYIFSNLRC